MTYPMSSESEAGRTLGAMMHGLASRGLRRIVVTSAGRGEGRSSITAEAGRALASAGRESVLLVDGDALEPGLHRRAGLPAGRGLCELLDEVYLADLESEDPKQFGLGDWIEIVRAQSRTGELTVSEGDRQFGLRIVKGSICSVSSTHLGEARLGDLLIKRGHITTQQRDDALRIQQQSCRPIGDVLGTMGWVSHGEIAEALRIQASERLVRLLDLQMPECRFVEMAEAYRPASGGRIPSVPDGEGIDDLVFGRLHGYLRHPFLSSQVPSYLTDTDLANLKVLTAGGRPCDPFSPRYLSSFSLLTGRLARSFDVTLIDAPPMSLPGVAGGLARLGDGALLVVKARNVDLAELRRAVEALRSSRSNLLGVVLNQVEEDDDDLGADEGLLN